MTEPLLSICIFTYNRAEAIYSLVNDLLKLDSNEIEVVVLDNNSDDDTQEKLALINDTRFRWYRCKEKIFLSVGFVEAIRLGRGKFCLMLQDDSGIAEISWGQVSAYLHINNDVACFYCEHQNQAGQPLRRLPANDSERNSIEAYKRGMNSGFACGIVYRREMLEKAYNMADRNDYLYSVYAHSYVAMLSAQFGKMSSLPGLITRQRKNIKSMNMDKRLTRYGNGEEPYWTAASRLEQKMDYIKLSSKITLNVSDKLFLLEQLFLDHLRFLVGYYDLVLPQNGLPIGGFRIDKEALLQEQNRSIGEYHNLFWHHVNLLNKATMSYHGGLHLLNEKFMADVNKVYDEFTKRIENVTDGHNKKKRDILLSICIPTYNRGKAAEECVKKWLEIPSNEIEVIVSDNGSPDDTQKRIEAIKDYRLVYYRNSFNVGAGINYTQVLTRAKGKWCLLISDEDDPKYTDWNRFRNLLARSKDTAVFRLPATGFVTVKPGRLEKDTFETYKYLFSQFSYMSGIIFNRDILSKVFVGIRKDTIAWGSYTHKVMALHCSKYGDVIATKDLEIIHARHERQDTSETYMYFYKDGDNVYMPEGRLQQFMSFMEETVSLATEDKVKLKCIDYYISALLGFVEYYHKRFIKPLDKTKKYDPNLTKYINKSESDWKELFLHYYRVMMKKAREVRLNNGNLKKTYKKETARTIYTNLKKALSE